MSSSTQRTLQEPCKQPTPRLAPSLQPRHGCWRPPANVRPVHMLAKMSGTMQHTSPLTSLYTGSSSSRLALPSSTSTSAPTLAMVLLTRPMTARGAALQARQAAAARGPAGNVCTQPGKRTQSCIAIAATQHPGNAREECVASARRISNIPRVTSTQAPAAPEGEVAGHALQHLLLPRGDLAHQPVHVHNAGRLEHRLDAVPLAVEVVAAAGQQTQQQFDQMGAIRACLAALHHPVNMSGF